MSVRRSGLGKSRRAKPYHGLGCHPACDFIHPQAVLMCPWALLITVLDAGLVQMLVYGDR